MNLELLQQVQKKQIEIMDMVHNLCVNEEISYYIVGGTALGAIRHGGFIPWDVDIDIAMPRGDYERFLAICDEKLPKNLICYHFRKESDYFPPHALISLDNSKMIQKYGQHQYFTFGRIKNVSIIYIRFLWKKAVVHL